MAGGSKKPAGPGAVDASLEERRRFSRFTESDAKLLAGLGNLFRRSADKLVDEFYDHLMEFESLRSLLSDAATVTSLKRAQREYLISLTAGEFGPAHVQNRLKIGRVHASIGLTPQWYLGMYGLYLDILRPYIEKKYSGERASAAMAALAKLFVIDMQIVLDAYYERRERRAVERSERLAAVGELAASIAHEVRNPLAGMKGALEVMRRELTSKPSYHEILDELVRQIERLEGLVRDLLTFAKPTPLDPRSFDLHELLDKVLRYFKDQADEAGITVRRTYGPGTGRLRADPSQMEQVFLNLVQNGVQAMEQGGTLNVTAQAEADAVIVAFEDTGSGIPPTVIGQVYQPFFTTKHRGSGLGLSIVKKIVDAHEGRIEIDSVPGKGTRVTVRMYNGEGS